MRFVFLTVLFVFTGILPAFRNKDSAGHGVPLYCKNLIRFKTEKRADGVSKSIMGKGMAVDPGIAVGVVIDGHLNYVDAMNRMYRIVIHVIDQPSTRNLIPRNVSC